MVPMYLNGELVVELSLPETLPITPSCALLRLLLLLLLLLPYRLIRV